jgi:hypothetical protein
MTLHAVRMTVGESAFWRIVRGWFATKRGSNGSTEEFVALAERFSGQQLDAVFQSWLFTVDRPPYPGGGAPPTTPAAIDAPALVHALSHGIGNRYPAVRR